MKRKNMDTKAVKMVSLVIMTIADIIHLQKAG